MFILYFKYKIVRYGTIMKIVILFVHLSVHYQNNSFIFINLKSPSGFYRLLPAFYPSAPIRLPSRSNLL